MSEMNRLGSFALACCLIACTPAAQARNWGDPFTPEQQAEAQRLIQAHGYLCDSVASIRDGFASGLVVKCLASGNREYWFDLEDHGGKWTVTAR